MSISRTIPLVSTGGTAIAKSIERSVLAALCAILLSISLAACGPAAPRTPSSSNVTVTPSVGSPIAGISVPAPPGSADRPLAPGQSGTQYLPNGLPAFQPARGVNADTLFAEKITDTDERFRRLENAVSDMRREFDSVMPAIVRLSAVEQDMQELLKQLQSLTGDTPTPEDFADAVPVPDVSADALPARPFPEAPADQGTQPVIETDASALIAAPEQSRPVSVEPEEDLPAAPGLSPADGVAEDGTGPPMQQSPPLPEPSAESRAPPPPPMAVVDKAPTPLTPVVSAIPETVTAPAPSTVAAAETHIMPATPADQTTVLKIRTGDQPKGITRLVLDLTGSSTYKLDLDNKEKILLIEMPQAGWSAAPKGTFANNPLLMSWTSEPMKDGQGTRLILHLRETVEITSNTRLANPYRIVLDMKKAL